MSQKYWRCRSGLPSNDHYDNTLTTTAIVQLNAETSYGIYIDFYYVMQLYSRGARGVNEAQLQHIFDIS
jgi:hypothetical protein